MIIVGFVLLAAAAVVAVALVIQNPATVTVHAFRWSWDVDLRWLFVAGLALTAIGLFGLAMMRLGGARYRRLHRERKVLAAENERLIKRAGTAERLPLPGEPRTAMPTAPAERLPAAPPARRPAAGPAPSGPLPSGPPPSGRPMAPATGSVAAPERPDDPSAHRPGLRERLAASRHRHEKE